MFPEQFTSGYGDNTEERESLLKDLSLEEVVETAKRLRRKGKA